MIGKITSKQTVENDLQIDPTEAEKLTFLFFIHNNKTDVAFRNKRSEDFGLLGFSYQGFLLQPDGFGA